MLLKSDLMMKQDANKKKRGGEMIRSFSTTSCTLHVLCAPPTMRLGTNCILMTCMLLYFMSVHTYHSMLNVVSLKLFTLLTETSKSTEHVPTCLLVYHTDGPALMGAGLKPAYYPSVMDLCSLTRLSKFPSWIT